MTSHIGSEIGAAAGRCHPECREWGLGGLSCRGPFLSKTTTYGIEKEQNRNG